MSSDCQATWFSRPTVPDASRTTTWAQNVVTVLHITIIHLIHTWMLTQSPGVKHLFCVCRHFNLCFKQKQAHRQEKLEQTKSLPFSRATDRHTLRTISTAVVWAFGFWLLVGCLAFVKLFKWTALPFLMGHRPHVNINENYWMQADVFLTPDVCVGMREARM